jgi:phosphate transport system permease protein
MIKDSHLILTEDAIIKVAKEVKQLVQSKQFESASRGEIASIAQHYDTLQSISFMAMGLSLFCSTVLGGLWGWKRISLKLRARNFVENTVRYLLILSSVIAIFITIGIILSLLFESIRFFKIVSITEFLFGLDWNPQMAMRQDQVGSSGAFGALPLFGGTILITCVALSLSLPIGLLSAIYMAECSTPRFRSIVKPIIEILAGIPTVVYGFFAVVTVAPLLHNFGALIGIDIAAESAVGTGIVMGIMIIPFISSLSDDVICAVPESLRHGSFGLGATLSETIRYVVIPAALPGIVAGVLLAVSRAIGETMIVVMAAGLSAHLTANPFESVTTVTVQIVSLLVGDQEFDSPKTLSAFALGLVLFLSTLALNVIALHVVRKYREKYD